jgi:hypothetical protein
MEVDKMAIWESGKLAKLGFEKVAIQQFGQVDKRGC